MGTRKNKIKAQEIFDELGFGRVNIATTPRQYQIPPATVIAMYKVYKAGVVYDDFAFSNSRIEKWVTPQFDTFRGKKERVNSGILILENGGSIYPSEVSIDFKPYRVTNWRLLRKNWACDLYLGREPMLTPKTREQIEARLLAYGVPRAPWVSRFDKRMTRPKIIEILKAGGHIHDDWGFLLPEFEVSERRSSAIHPLVLNGWDY